MTTNDPLTTLNLLTMALNKMAPHSRDSIPKSTMENVRNLVNISGNTIAKYPLDDFTKAKFISLSQLIDTILGGMNFIELDSTGKDIIVRTLNELIYNTSLFACKFYLTNEFQFYPGLENLLTSVVRIGVLNNIKF